MMLLPFWVFADVDTFDGQTGIDTWDGQTGIDTVCGQTVAGGEMNGTLLEDWSGGAVDRKSVV